MTDIQQARDVFAKWRTGDMADRITHGVSLIPLVDGTAGNPDLLDAIDGLLEQAFIHVIEHDEDMIDPLVISIAAAIIAADERMNA